MDESLLFGVWLAFRILFIGLLIVFLISGIDDLFVDILYYGRLLFRALFRRKQVKPVTLQQLKTVPEKTAAIVIPAWDEEPVIFRMLLNTVSTIDYKNYHVFVGTYPNDEATKLEVEKAREIYPNIDVIVTPSDGPTNKADCLNWVFQGIRVFEKDNHVRFEFFVMHDAEDIVHPLSLRYYNYLIPRMHFIQVPVFPFEAPWTHFVTGIYMDEFAESHTKDLRVRELLATSLPSAGVGTAISREALDYLAAKNRNQVFDISSLTEDYLLGIKLHDFEGKKIFLQQNVVVDTVPAETPSGRESREPLATREYFPSNFRDAVRQKARWILGIALQGWSVGWTNSWGQNYFLFRDRKSVITNLVVVLGYVVVLYSAVDAVIRWMTPVPPVPPLIEPDEIYFTFLKIVLCLFAWRLLNRALSSGRIYGWKQGLLAIPRLFVGNVLNFCATTEAIRRFVQAKVAGTVPEWGKTEHAFPTENQLRGYRRRLGGLLLDRHFITTAQLQQALDTQKKTGRRLGDILVNMGALGEEDLVQTLAQQNDEVFVEIDPYITAPQLIELIPQSVAENYHVFPLRMEGDHLILAADNLNTQGRKAELEKALGVTVSLQWASTIDIEFALRRAYTKHPVVAPHAAHRLGGRLMRTGKISEETLNQALRRQKRSNRKLGEILIEMGCVSSADVNAALNNTPEPDE